MKILFSFLFLSTLTFLYATDNNLSIYSHTIQTIDLKPKPLSDYKGKVLLIVNVASRCGLTKHYAGLEKLYKTYKNKGFVVLGFPCNNFGGQEPGTLSEIKKFCTEKFSVTFPMFEKIQLKGKKIHPLYEYLTNFKSDSGPVKWNFEKFLIGKNGQIIQRYRSRTDPLSPKLTQNLKKALSREF